MPTARGAAAKAPKAERSRGGRLVKKLLKSPRSAPAAAGRAASPPSAASGRAPQSPSTPTRRSASPPAPQSGTVGLAARAFAEGDHARLYGLQNETVRDLNGEVVRLESWMADKLRWKCVCESGRRLNVREENLQRLPDSVASPLDSARKRRLSGKGPRLDCDGVEGAIQSSAASASRASPSAPPPPPGKRTVEETYQKKTQLEHILLRPDSYVGSMEKQASELWVLSGAPLTAVRRMERRKIEYVPALYKIFDEIIVNAADNLIRDPTMDKIRVTIDVATSRISVWNNGQGVPVEIHKVHKVYVPEMVFGHLLTSDNYDDTEQKVVGGRNGYGAKLTNIFSNRFTVETADSRRRRRYRQTWRRNMSERGEPEISEYGGGQSTDFTCVTFEPDLNRFSMKTLEADIVALMRRRAYDVAASTRGRCHVFLDGQELEVRSFEDYVGLYLEPDAFRVVETCNERWEVAVALTDGSGFQQVSFVNSICTTRGGTHVKYIEDQIVPALMEKIGGHKGDKGQLIVKPQHVRSHLWIFVNCLVENPSFDSQTKDTLTSKKERFGSTCALSDDTLAAILESGLTETLIAWSTAMGKSDLAKHLNKSEFGQRKRLFGIQKLEDANNAGTKLSGGCTLILTEGDSAKSLAVAGLGVIGRDNYGVFPLRGKLRNVRELNVKQMKENKEIEQLAKILALDASKQYESTAGLRYGSVMIMTDQDFDGSHIKGLIINLFQHWFPGLLRTPGFMKEFVTPIVKMTRGEEIVTFFTIPEYNTWKSLNNDGRGWKCKYYKGLGTSTSAEAREYFSDLDNHSLTFTHSGGDEDDNLIDMAFNQKRADDRKKWITNCADGTFVDHSQPTLSYSDFIEKELVLFAKYDVERMIPSLVDGLKTGQRKVLFGAFKKKITSDIKVAQLSGYVAEHSSYHHGEVSLQGTIISMAQTFVGSNNLNLLVPSGQFGTRLQGGKDHAASRYIFTRLAPVTRRLFPDDDDPILEYLSEEGLKIEPRWYCPVIPLVLVNGAEGIGTGWSTSIPCYNPREIVLNVRRYLRREPLQVMMPWYRGFQGAISPVLGEKLGRFETLGCITKRNRTRVEVRELPVRRWTQDYKEWLLEQLKDASEKSEKRAVITDVKEYHTDNTVHFCITVMPDKLAQIESKAGGLEKHFHLKSTISTSNMWLFDREGKLKKYATPEEILTEFAAVRLDMYVRRKEYQIRRYEGEVALLSDRAKFVRLVVDGVLEVQQRPAKDVCVDIRKHGLRTMRELRALGPSGNAASLSEARKEATAAAARGQAADNGKDGYGYLLAMKLWTLTADRLAQLEKLVEQSEHLLRQLREKSPKQLWEADLLLLEKALDERDAEEKREHNEAERLARKAGVAEDKDDGLSNKQCALVISKTLEIKRVRTGDLRATKRGTCGLPVQKALKTKSEAGANAEHSGEDGVDDEPGGTTDEQGVSGVFPCREFDALLAFTDNGYVCALQALDVPLRKRTQSGQPLAELFPKLGQHRIVAVISVPQEALKPAKGAEQNRDSVLLVTKKGRMKRLSLSALGGAAQRASRTAAGMILAFGLDADDSLRCAQRATLEDVAVLTSAAGFVVCFKVSQAFPKVNGMKNSGKPAIKLLSRDFVAGLDVANLSSSTVHSPASTPNRSTKTPSAFMLFLQTNNLSASQGGTKWQETSAEVRQSFLEQAAAARAQATAVKPAVSSSKRSRAQVDDDDSDGYCEPDSRSTCQTSLPQEGLAEKVALDTHDDPDDEEDADEDGDEAAGHDEEECDKDDDDEEDMDGEGEDETAGGPVLSVVSPTNTSELVPNTNGLPLAGSAPKVSSGKVPSEQCVLLVSEGGFGKRVRLQEFKLMKRNTRGVRAVRLSEKDLIASCCVVPSDEIPQLPQRPHDPWVMYRNQRIAEAARAAAAAAAVAASVLADKGCPLATKTNDATRSLVASPTEPLAQDNVALFEALPEEERLLFQERHTREVELYTAAVEARRLKEQELSKLGQVLLCTSKGLISRVQLATVPVMKKGTGGRALMRVKGGDCLNTASLISALDEDDRAEEMQATTDHIAEDGVVDSAFTHSVGSVAG